MDVYYISLDNPLDTLNKLHDYHLYIKSDEKIATTKNIELSEIPEKINEIDKIKNIRK